MASTRLDRALVERGLCATIERAVAEIRSGNVLVDDRVVDKPGTRVAAAVPLRLRAPPSRFVSRGGLKLDAGIESFGVTVAGRVCADLGASTGGFTDCLLQRGAARVYAIDVGYGQLAWSLRQDPRVVVMERVNARHLESLPEPVSLVVGDLSFISLRAVIPAIRRLLAGAGEAGEAVLLVKPQFEVARGDVARGGVVAEESLREEALGSIRTAAAAEGFTACAAVESPVTGARAKNREWLLHLRAPAVRPAR